MYNIMKAQKYQLIHDNFTYIVFFCGLVMMWISFLMNAEEGLDISKDMASGYVVNSGMSFLTVFLMLAYTSRICGGDLSDRTVNFELLAGKKKSAVYFGRLLVSIIVGIIVYLIFCILPVIVISAVWGWGHTMPVKEGAIRLALGFLPPLRLICFFACLTFLTRSPLGTVAVGFITILAESLFGMLADDGFLPFGIEKLAPFLSLASAETVEKYNMKMDYINGEDVEVLKDMMSSGTIIMLVVSCVIACAVFSILGYTVFKKKDMD